MRKLVTSFILGAALAASHAPSAKAGPISRACIAADRQAASRALCGCLQSVANQSLTRSEQRRAAKFFKDPSKAQEVRQSDSSRDSKFWKRYKAFGARVESTCSGVG